MSLKTPPPHNDVDGVSTQVPDGRTRVVRDPDQRYGWLDPHKGGRDGRGPVSIILSVHIPSHPLSNLFICVNKNAVTPEFNKEYDQGKYWVILSVV